MRKFYFLAALAVMITMSSQAQEDISFGVKGGTNFATFGGRDFLVDQKARIGFHLGVLVEIPISEKFSIQPELMYSQQGSRTASEITVTTGPNDPGTRASSEVISKYDYISIPVLARYTIVQGLSLEAGPQFGFNINAEAELNGNLLGEDISSTEDFSDITNTFDIGLALGGSYELPVGVFFQARYVLGLSNVDDSEVQEGGLNEDSLLNRMFQLSAGFKF